MDKEFLGLGLTFWGMDKGLNKSLKTTQDNLGRTTDALKQTEQAASAGGAPGGVFSGMVEGFKLLSIGRIGSAIEEMNNGLRGTERTVDDVFQSLDTLGARLGTVFDPSQARRFQGAVLGIMQTTGTSAQAAEELAMGMVRFGRTAEEARKALPVMGELVGVMGLEAGNVSQMFGQGLATLRATPKQLEGLIKQTVRLQKQYQLTDQVSTLPDIFEAVTQNAARFGKVQSEVAIRTVQQVSGLSAIFQRLGRSQGDATNIATGFQGKLSEMVRSIEDMKVGLAPLDESIFDFASVLRLAGINGDQAFDMITKGVKKPKDFLLDLQSRFKDLDQFTQKAVGARIRRIFGDDIANALTSYSTDLEGVIKKTEEQGKKVGGAEDAFAAQSAALRGTVEVQQNLTKATEQYFDLQLAFLNKAKVIDRLQLERAAQQKVNEAVGETNNLLGNTFKWLDLIKKTGLLGIFPSEFVARIGIIGERLSQFVFPLTSLVGLFTVFKAPIKAVIGLFTGLAGSVFSLIGRLTGLSLLFGATKKGAADTGKGIMSFLGRVTGLTAGIDKAKDALELFWIKLRLDVFPKLGAVVSKFVGGPLKMLVGGMGRATLGVLKFLALPITGPFKLLSRAISVVSSKLVSVLAPALTTVTKGFMAGIKWIGLKTTTLLKSYVPALSMAGKGVVGFTSKIGLMSLKVLKFLALPITGPFILLGKMLKFVSARIMATLVPALSTGIKWVVAKAASLVGTLVPALATAGKGVLGFAGKLLGTFMSGVATAGKGVLRLAGQVGVLSLKFLKLLALPIVGPFMLAAKAAKFLSVQLVKGLGMAFAFVAKGAVSLGAKMVAAVTPAMAAIAKGAAALGAKMVAALAPAIATVTGKIAAMSAMMLANPIGLIVAGIIALGAAVVGMVVYWDEIKAAVSNFVDWIMPKLTAVGEFLKGAFFGYVEFVKGFWKGLMDFFSGAIEAFKAGGFGGVWDFFKEQAIAAITAVENFFAGLGPKIIAFVRDSLGDTAASVVEWIGGAISTYWNGIKSLWSGTIKFFGDAIDSFKKGGISGVWEFLKTSATNALKSVQQFFAETWKNIVDGATKKLKEIPEFFVKKFKDMLKSPTIKKLAGFFGFDIGEGERKEQPPERRGIPVETDVVPERSFQVQTPITEVLREGTTRMVPAAMQPGVPERARFAMDVAPERRVQFDGESMKDLVAEINDMHSDLVDAIKELAGQEIKIEMKGDMGKFISFVKKEQGNALGSRGLGFAVNRGG